jgi:succinate dehydrogenase hydrophobic anchor subunit
VIAMLVAHAFLAVRKFPINYRQFTIFRSHMKMLHHEDTTLWFWQVVTGFALFFFAAPHLYVVLTHPELIGPFESSDRVWTGHYWPLYILLLSLSASRTTLHCSTASSGATCRPRGPNECHQSWWFQPEGWTKVHLAA